MARSPKKKPSKKTTAKTTPARKKPSEAPAPPAKAAAKPAPPKKGPAADQPKDAKPAPPAKAGPSAAPTPPTESKQPARPQPAAPASAPKRSDEATAKNDHDALVAQQPAHRPDLIPDHVSEPRPSFRSQGEPLLVEVAWEVCNQLGGIYTVLRSKAPTMVQEWPGRYLLVGPYNHSSAQVEFEELPLEGPVGQAVQQLRDWGVWATYGTWLVTGRPKVVLIQYLDVFKKLHEIKYFLWQHHGIPMPSDDEMLNNVAAFGEGCRMFFHALNEAIAGERPVVAHFHEWMAGAAVPMLRRDQWSGSIVFTTHATLLGRYLAMNDDQFHEHLGFYNPENEAYHFRVEPQYKIERAAAHGAHVFTTVSDITAEECKHLLGREPDALLPNGLNIQRFAAIHEFQNLHRVYKEKIHQFVIGHFFPSYTFDLDRTLYFFTSGRYEPRNKGMDLTIESLARLNHRLKQLPDPPTVVAFIVTKRPFRSINVRTLQTNAMLEEFATITDHIKEQVGEKLFYEASAGRVPDLNSLVDEYWTLRLKRTMHAWRSDMPPTIVTHDLEDDQKDAVLNQLRQCQLWNQKHDPVKVIYHPDFISATNPLWGIEYDQFVRGCHLGVFPSYYEPWGYTPLESIALGVPAITSDLAGFGSYLMNHLPDAESRGAYIIRRRYCSYFDAAEQLANRMFDFARMNRRDRITLRNATESFSTHFDWSNLGAHYSAAHKMALKRRS